MSALVSRAVILSIMIPLAAPIHAADLTTYRGFTFGNDVAAVAQRAGQAATAAKVLHQGPAVIEEITLPLRSMVDEGERVDPVKEIVFRFLDGKLYRIAAYYDRYRIEGMMPQDLIEVISRTYGVASMPLTEIPFQSNYSDVAKVLARWEDAEYAYDLVRTGDQSSFAFVSYSKGADAAARTAILEAKRLEEIDAPRKALEQARQRAEADRLALEKARAQNKPNFRP